MTSSAARLADRSGQTGVVDPTVGWRTTGRVSALAALVLCVLIQALNHDYFPPDISVSQYGVGRNGWVFTAWAAITSLAILSLYRAGPERSRVFGCVLVVGSIGLLVMGVVRTDAGGLQQSWHAKVHMVGSVVGLVALPIGMAMALRWARPWWQRVAWALVVVSSLALVLVLISAAGVATPGLDAPHSWALWQSVAVTVDMLLLTTFALASYSAAATPPPTTTGGGLAA